MNNTLSYKRIPLFLTFLALLGSSVAQESATDPEARYPYRREISSGNFGKVAQKIEKKLAKEADDVAYNYAAYRLWSAKGFEDRDLALAYQHLATAYHAYAHSAPRQIERLERDGFDGALFSSDFRRIGLLALAQARAAATPDVFSDLLAIFTDIPDDIIASATYSRDSLELDIARRAGRTQDIHAFILLRPDSPLLPQAQALRDSSAFADAQQAHTTQAYEVFINEFPSSAQYQRAKDSLYTIAFRQAEQAGAEHLYRAYAERYPESPLAASASWRADSILYHTSVNPADWRSLVLYLDSPTPHTPYWHSFALHSLATIALDGHDVEAVAQALAHTPTSDSLRLLLASRLRRDYLIPSITNFHRLYGAYGRLLPSEWRTHDSLALALYNSYRFDIIDSCIHAIAPAHEAYIMLQQLIDHDIRYGRAAEALKSIEPFRDDFVGSEEFSRLAGLLADSPAAPTRPTAQPLKLLNAECSHPVPSIDGKTLYFSAKGHSSNIGGGDIFSARGKGKTWSSSHIEMDLSHTYGNEAPLSVTADGNTMLTLQSGRLFICRRDSASRKWLPAEPLLADFPMPIADACLTADGMALLLSIPGKEAYQTDTSLNLYVLEIGNEELGMRNLIDLGPTVNTPFADRAPYLASDMKTLYFASEGHGSLGQLDLFVVTRPSDDRWDLWSEPRNLGLGINTVDNETWIRLSPDGKTVFSHRRARQMEIVTYQLP
ncbi:MAG: PD40 domain-containing protein [Bacteroidales bacterium]|nr:PD40 domain-containing protein [Bacteroidales bacterium]